MMSEVVTTQPAAQVALMELTHSAMSLALAIRQHERDSHAIAKRAYALHQRWQSLDNAIRPAGSFKHWLSQTTGLPEGSVSYYVNIGAVVASGMDTEGKSVRDLRAAGAALLAGAPVSEVDEALSAGTAQEYGEARHSAGMVRVQIPQSAKALWDAELKRWQRLTQLPEPEVRLLMIAAAQYLDDEAIRALAQAGAPV